jgi:predicted AAA+ superfamily ATPase
MHRFIEQKLNDWAKSPIHKPLILHGARQVGKTFTVRKFGQTFENFIEVNFEAMPHLKTIFKEGLDLSASRIIRDLSLTLKKDITPGKSLLFIDEIQEAPNAILALRYLYEEIPELHVIAAGSLINFAIEQVGVPVGRVTYLYLYPMSWFEFLHALGHHNLIEQIINHDVNVTESEAIHEHILSLLQTYLAIGGMPEVVECWKNTKDPRACQQIQQEILNSYRQDFHKYARDKQIKYVELVFDRAIMQLGKKFQFSNLATGYRKRELEPALELLEKACVIHRVWHSSGQSIPIGSQISLDKYKLIFLDIGLSQTLLGLDLADWFLHGNRELANKGTIIESFVGQELLAYSSPHQQAKLFYWLREMEAKGSSAEIDYLIQMKSQVVPIEVKSSKGNSLKSMRLFLETHPHTEFGIRYSTHNYSLHNSLYSYPLYAIPLSIEYKF